MSLKPFLSKSGFNIPSQPSKELTFIILAIISSFVWVKEKFEISTIRIVRRRGFHNVANYFSKI
ncbi:MAG: hypothetical protein DI622_18875, partial [Chryseobacterium sp.]